MRLKGSPQLTAKLILTAVLFLLGVEAWGAYTLETGDLISEVMWDWIAEYPIVTAGIFFLLGHWFWQQQSVYRARRKEKIRQEILEEERVKLLEGDNDASISQTPKHISQGDRDT